MHVSMYLSGHLSMCLSENINDNNLCIYLCLYESIFSMLYHNYICLFVCLNVCNVMQGNVMYLPVRVCGHSQVRPSWLSMKKHQGDSWAGDLACWKMTCSYDSYHCVILGINEYQCCLSGVHGGYFAATIRSLAGTCMIIHWSFVTHLRIMVQLMCIGSFLPQSCWRGNMMKPLTGMWNSPTG